MTIISPKEGETISTKRPDIFGSASSSISINFTLEPGGITGTTNSIGDGTWHWSPPRDLLAGSYIVTVTAKNSQSGFVESVSRKFSTTSTGSGLAFTASGSAVLVTPTLTAIPTLVTTIAPTQSPVQAPTISQTPTLMPTIKPTVAIIPTTAPIVRTTKPSTSSGVPATGSPLATIFLVSLAGLFVAASFLF